jgi:hypothetical protein
MRASSSRFRQPKAVSSRGALYLMYADRDSAGPGVRRRDALLREGTLRWMRRPSAARPDLRAECEAEFFGLTESGGSSYRTTSTSTLKT